VSDASQLCTAAAARASAETWQAAERYSEAR
jgi:hypothetical protein